MFFGWATAGEGQLGWYVSSVILHGIGLDEFMNNCRDCRWWDGPKEWKPE